jgi:hypothetical protein
MGEGGKRTVVNPFSSSLLFTYLVASFYQTQSKLGLGKVVAPDQRSLFSLDRLFEGWLSSSMGKAQAVTAFA